MARAPVGEVLQDNVLRVQDGEVPITGAQNVGRIIHLEETNTVLFIAGAHIGLQEDHHVGPLITELLLVPLFGDPLYAGHQEVGHQ